MIRWALLTILATGLFWGLYRLLLCRDRWLQLSRAYLIITLVFGLAYPLVKLPEKIVPITSSVVTLEEITVVPSSEASPTPALHATTSRVGTWVLPAIYVGGVAITLMILMLSVVQVLVRLQRTPCEKHNGVRLSLLDDETEPFSFFNHIIIGTRAMNEEEVRLVLAHEGEHVRLGHSMDVLVVKLMCCVAWFNPFAWLILRELRAVHEYQADAAAQKEMNKAYLCLLYRQTTGFGYGHITHNFHSINLKKRITMMKQTKSRFGAWKALAALPLAALLMMVGCNSATNEEANTTEKQQPETTVNGTEKQQQEIVANINDTIYDGTGHPAEVYPEFPGGMEELYKYLAQNIQYPEQAKNENTQGRVVISFVVEKDGSITDAKVTRGIGGGCDEEALRVVNAMPKWTPGKVRGENVRVEYNLPINFKLQ